MRHIHFLEEHLAKRMIMLAVAFTLGPPEAHIFSPIWGGADQMAALC